MLQRFVSFVGEFLPKQSKPRDMDFSDLAKTDKITYSFYVPDDYDFASPAELERYRKDGRVEKVITDPAKIATLVKIVQDRSKNWVIYYYYTQPAFPGYSLEFYSKDSRIRVLNVVKTGLCLDAKKGLWEKRIEVREIKQILEILNLSSSIFR